MMKKRKQFYELIPVKVHLVQFLYTIFYSVLQKTTSLGLEALSHAKFGSKIDMYKHS